MTEEKFKNKMVVIFAGYEQPVLDLLASNDGLESRFPERIMFPNFDAAACVKIFQSSPHLLGIDRAANLLENLPSLFQKLIDAPKFSNARGTRHVHTRLDMR